MTQRPFGIAIDPDRSIPEPVDRVRRAEALGVDTVDSTAISPPVGVR